MTFSEAICLLEQLANLRKSIERSISPGVMSIVTPEKWIPPPDTVRDVVSSSIADQIYEITPIKAALILQSFAELDMTPEPPFLDKLSEEVIQQRSKLDGRGISGLLQVKGLLITFTLPNCDVAGCRHIAAHSFSFACP